MKSAAIGVFDSGLGGLTVAREIARALPRIPASTSATRLAVRTGRATCAEVRRFVLEIGSVAYRRSA